MSTEPSEPREELKEEWLAYLNKLRWRKPKSRRGRTLDRAVSSAFVSAFWRRIDGQEAVAEVARRLGALGVEPDLRGLSENQHRTYQSEEGLRAEIEWSRTLQDW